MLKSRMVYWLFDHPPPLVTMMGMTMEHYILFRRSIDDRRRTKRHYRYENMLAYILSCSLSSHFSCLLNAVCNTFWCSLVVSVVNDQTILLSRHCFYNSDVGVGVASFLCLRP